MASFATRLVAVRDPGSGDGARDISRHRRGKEVMFTDRNQSTKKRQLMPKPANVADCLAL